MERTDRRNQGMRRHRHDPRRGVREPSGASTRRSSRPRTMSSACGCVARVEDRPDRRRDGASRHRDVPLPPMVATIDPDRACLRGGVGHVRPYPRTAFRPADTQRRLLGHRSSRSSAFVLAWPTRGISLAILGGYVILYWRICRYYALHRGWPPADARLNAAWIVLAKFPQAVGVVRYRLGRLRGRAEPPSSSIGISSELRVRYRDEPHERIASGPGNCNSLRIESTQRASARRFPGYRIHRRLARQGARYDPRRVAGGGLRQGFAPGPDIRRTLRGGTLLRVAGTDARGRGVRARRRPRAPPSGPACSDRIGLDRRGAARLPGKAHGHRCPGVCRARRAGRESRRHDRRQS